MTAEPLPTRLPDPGECPDCAEARQMLMEERIRRQDAEKDLAGKRAQITKLKDELAGKRKTDPLYDTALTIWKYWKAKCKPKARKMSDQQLKALLHVLKAKLPDSDELAYPPRFICEAILGCSIEHFVDGKGKHHNGLELICSKLEEMHERYERHRGGAG